MKLSRITKLHGHRVFRDFAWPADLHTFGQFNLIYGWNGCGKTTLSSLLALVEKRTVLSEGELELQFDGGATITGTELATKPAPSVRVFNREFIHATLLSTNGIAPIYFLGEQSAEKQTQVEKLKADLSSAQADVANRTKEKQVAESKLDEFRIDRAKFVKELLTTASDAGYNNYDKRRFGKAIDVLAPGAVAAVPLSDEEKVRLRSQKDAQPKGTIGKVFRPSVDLPALQAEVEELTARSVVAQTLDELTKDLEVGSWVQRGLALHSRPRHSDTCRFCQQELGADRRRQIESHFNDAFTAFEASLDELASKLEAQKTSLSSLQLPELTRFYDHLIGEATAAIDRTRAPIADAVTFLEVLLAGVKARRENPLGARPVAAAAPSAESSRLPGAFDDLNAVTEKHNKISEDFKRSVGEACKRLEAAYVAEAQPEYLQLKKVLGKAEAALEASKDKPQTLQLAIAKLEAQIVEHRRPADELTEELRAYLGRDELRFELEGNGYALMRGGQPVSHLSEGERTAIAFLYFLKSLQDKAFDTKKGIVVIDDPVSSLDANALFSAFGYMKERTKECGQLFILTHSFPFFRLVKNWFHHLHGQRKKNAEERPARFFLLRPRRHVDGSRTSQLGPLDPLLQEFESEYQYLFKRVYDEAHRPNVDSLEQHYGLPNVARRLVEAFLAFRFPDLSGDLRAKLERVNFDHAKKTRILRLLHTYSHADAISEPEHDLSLLAETQPVLLDLLDMMKAVDKDHFDGLEKLMTPPQQQ